MARYILLRVLGLIAVLLIVSVITFVLMHGVPGGPWQYGERPFTDQQLAALKKLYGLDRPLVEQYFSWLRGVLRLDFGRSFQYPDRSVTALIRDTWPTTLHLGLMTIIVAFGLGLPLGIIAALRQNTWIDYLTTLLSVLGYVTPHFVWAILFILVFSLTFKWFPTGGWDSPRNWVMPVMAYALAPMAVIARYTRSSVLDVVRQDYVRTAHAKGLRENTVVFRHMMKNALIPMITVFAPLIPDLITGSIFIEAIFRVPGLGRYWVTSTVARDYPMIIGMTVLWSVLIAVTYLLTDILYVLVDPRVTYT